jgi:hypothetical protein
MSSSERIDAKQSRKLWKVWDNGIFAGWLPRLLTEEYKRQRKNVPSQSVGWYSVEGNNFPYSIAMGGKLPFHHFDPESKRQCMDWHHTISEINAAQPFATTGTVLWVAEG